jgi:hypothetical protein
VAEHTRNQSWRTASKGAVKPERPKQANWLRAHGKGYQSRINAILRREMLASLKITAAKEG